MVESKPMAKQCRRAFSPPHSIRSYEITHSRETLYVNTVQNLQLDHSLATTWKSAHLVQILTWEKHLKVFWVYKYFHSYVEKSCKSREHESPVQIPPPVCVPYVTIAEM
jgi:hypothetical protein